MLVIGIDAATITTGWAVVDVRPGLPKLVASGTIGGTRAADILALSRAWAPKVQAAAVEEPYLDPRKGVATMRKLAGATERWLMAWELAGVPCRAVRAQEWQCGVLAGLAGPQAPREQRKRAAAIWTRAQFGAVLSEDVADAACLAFWEGRRLAFGKRAA
jgi:Holliday junction resolvasome RuvABC endonuclease subunit